MSQSNQIDDVLSEIQPQLEASGGTSTIRRAVLGSDLSTFCVGGPVEALVTVSSAQELCAVRKIASAAGVPIAILGNGSNVLIADSGLAGILVKLAGRLRSVRSVGEGLFDLGAAASLMSVARKLSGEGFSGLEFAAGIPATCGGALFMNAGAHGAELGERVVSVEGVDSPGNVVRFEGSDLPWRYRSSGLPPEVFVTSARIRLTSGDSIAISAALAHNLAERRMRQPLTLPSAGSVFKNPSPERPAGRVLEEAGLKGARVGGAVVSTLHANWIVNPDRTATARDVAELIRLCQSKVRESSGVELQPEVRIW